jgi:pyridoxamine 5'-phosphate oxidase-like protein
MPALALPPAVEAVFREFRTCEFTTVNRSGQPLTWPTEPYYDVSEGRLIVTASIAFPIKTYNARRHPQVALLFSDPTGAAVTNPPAVLVQGDATVAELTDDPPWSYDMLREAVRRQPRTRQILRNPMTRSLFTFYFQRIAIYIRPRRILVWPDRDFSATPTAVEVSYVE